MKLTTATLTSAVAAYSKTLKRSPDYQEELLNQLSRRLQPITGDRILKTSKVSDKKITAQRRFKIDLDTIEFNLLP
jgi:hypothetical protein